MKHFHWLCLLLVCCLVLVWSGCTSDLQDLSFAPISSQEEILSKELLPDSSAVNSLESTSKESDYYNFISQAELEGKALFDQTGFIENAWFDGTKVTSLPTSSSLQMGPSKYTINTEKGAYYYNSSGELIDFSIRPDARDALNLPEMPLYSEEKLRQIGEKYLSGKVDLQKYPTYTATNFDYDRYFGFVYQREVKGYPSFEEVSVEIGYDGTVVGFVLRRVGVFDSIDEASIPDIDHDEILKKLDVMAKADPNWNWSEVPYTVPNRGRLVILTDGTFAIHIEIHKADDWHVNQFYYIPLE